MRTRKPTTAQRTDELKAELRQRKMMLKYCHNPEDKKEIESWIDHNEKKTAGFYAPAIR